MFGRKLYSGPVNSIARAGGLTGLEKKHFTLLAGSIVETEQIAERARHRTAADLFTASLADKTNNVLKERLTTTLAQMDDEQRTNIRGKASDISMKNYDWSLALFTLASLLALPISKAVFDAGLALQIGAAAVAGIAALLLARLYAKHKNKSKNQACHAVQESVNAADRLAHVQQ